MDCVVNPTISTEGLAEQSASPSSASINDLVSLSRIALTKIWVQAYGRPPPKGLSRRLLEFAIAYHLQAKSIGGLSVATKRRLRQLARSPSEPDQAPPSARPALRSGSRLVREWHGTTHTVDATDSGFLYKGHYYRSLSEVARAITGAHWSGPRFFGT